MEIDLGKPIIDPELGDVTQEVIAELIAMNQLGTPVELEERQTRLAQNLGMEGREFAGGHSVAMIDQEVAMRWIRQRGVNEFMHDVVPYLAKHFPQTRVKYRPEKTTVAVSAPTPPAPRFAVTGRRGRWALNGAT